MRNSGANLCENRQRLTEVLRRYAGSMASSSAYTLDCVSMMFVRDWAALIPEFHRVVKEEYCAHVGAIGEPVATSQVGGSITHVPGHRV